MSVMSEVSEVSVETIVLSGMAMTTAGGVAGRLGPVPAGVGVVSDLQTRAEPEPAGPSRLADRPSAMATDALDVLLSDVLEDCPPERRGLVLGSGSAGIDQSMTLTSTSLTRARPYNVPPALVPACVMNYASALCAIRFDLQGPNATVTAGRVTGLAALGYAERLLRLNRADLVVCGAYEDLNDRRTALQAVLDADGGYAAPGEGCCVFLAETASRASRHGRPILAEIVALDSGVAACRGDRAVVLGHVVGRALTRAGAAGEEIALVSVSGDEQRLLGPVLPNARWIRPADVVGDTLGAAAAFQVGGAVLAERPSSAPTLAMVVATDPDGQIGCAVLRLPAR